MDKNTETTNVLLNDVPLSDLAAIEQQAQRRGWARVKMIRHILAQAASRERKLNGPAANPMLASAASDTPKAG